MVLGGQRLFGNLRRLGLWPFPLQPRGETLASHRPGEATRAPNPSKSIRTDSQLGCRWTPQTNQTANWNHTSALALLQSWRSHRGRREANVGRLPRMLPCSSTRFCCSLTQFSFAAFKGEQRGSNFHRTLSFLHPTGICSNPDGQPAPDREAWNWGGGGGGRGRLRMFLTKARLKEP